MKNYCLKNKLVVTEEFLNDLTTKSWQEVEQLQTQITSIERITFTRPAQNLAYIVCDILCLGNLACSHSRGREKRDRYTSGRIGCILRHLLFLLLPYACTQGRRGLRAEYARQRVFLQVGYLGHNQASR